MKKTNDTQRPVFEQLVFGPLAANLTEILYPDRRAQDTIYSEFAYKVREPLTEKGGKKIEHDAVILMRRYGPKKNGKDDVLKKDVIAFEIKTTAGDVADSSVEKYLGATRLFFIAAPAALLPVIIDKYYVKSRKNSHVIGLIDSDTGQVVVRPQFQIRNDDRQDRLLAHCYSSVHRIPKYTDSEPFSVHQVSGLPGEKVTWVDIVGLKVNRKYLGYF